MLRETNISGKLEAKQHKRCVEIWRKAKKKNHNTIQCKMTQKKPDLWISVEIEHIQTYIQSLQCLSPNINSNEPCNEEVEL